MDDEGARVPDVREVAHELGRLDEPDPGLVPAPDAEGEDGARAPRHVLLREVVVAAARKARVVHPRDEGVVLEEAGHRHGVVAVPIHPHRQGLEALEHEERIERAQGRPHRAKRLAPRLHGVAEVAERLVEADPVVAPGGLHHPREVAVVVGEAAGLDDDPPHARSVTPDVLRGRVHHDVRPPFEGAAEVGRRERVVDDERDAAIGGDCPHRLEVEHIDGGVAEGLAVEDLRPVRDRAGEVLGVVGVHEGSFDAHPTEGHVEERAGAAVEGARGHDVVPRLEKRQQGGGLCRLSARGGERGPPVLERRHPLLEDGGGGVHEPGVDVPEGLEVEQARGVVRVVEHVRGGLVDRHRPRAGGGVGELPGVQAQGLEPKVAISHQPVPSAPKRAPSAVGRIW